MCNGNCENCMVRDCMARKEAVETVERKPMFDKVGTIGSVLFASFDGKMVMVTTMN